MEIEIKRKDLIIIYEDTEKKRDLVFEKLLNWYIEKDCLLGEVLQQSDDCLLDAPNILSDILDNIIKFEYKYKDE